MEIKIKNDIEQNIGGRFKKRFKAKRLKSSIKYFDANSRGSEDTVDGEIKLKTQKTKKKMNKS